MKYLDGINAILNRRGIPGSQDPAPAWARTYSRHVCPKWLEYAQLVKRCIPQPCLGYLSTMRGSSLLPLFNAIPAPKCCSYPKDGCRGGCLKVQQLWVKDAVGYIDEVPKMSTYLVRAL